MKLEAMSGAAEERAAAPAAESGEARAASILRPPSRIVSLRWIAALAAVALTTAAVLSVGAVAERNTRRALTREIETRLLLEARNLALTSSEALLADFPELTLHPLVKEMKSEQPELVLVVVVDHQGVIQGDPDVRRLGTQFSRSEHLKVVKASQALAHGELMYSDGTVLIASAPVTHRNGPEMGTAMVGLDLSYLDRLITEARRQQSAVLGMVLTIGVAVAFILMSFLLKPIGELRAGIERIGRGDLETPLRLRDRTELGMLAGAVNDMAAALRRAQAEMVERERLAHEVELARQIQGSLLPNRELVIGEFVVCGSQRAAAEVGGDFYDFFELPGQRLGIAVADVAGKGLAGCLVMSMLSALLRAYREVHSEPATLLAVLDEQLGETLQSGSFVTMFYGVLETRTGQLTYASAGHCPMLVYRGDGGDVEWFKTTGIPLGAIRGGVIRRTLKNDTIRLLRGDVLVQYTDGVNEAFDASGREQFGFERMAKAVGESAQRGCHAVILGLHRRVEEWVGNAPALDDETVLVVSREGGLPLAVVPGQAKAGVPTVPVVEAQEALTLLADAQDRGAPLRLPASLEALSEIRGWLTGSTPHGSLAAAQLEVLYTALYEVCANIAEHGCAQDAGQRYELWWVPASEASRHGAAPVGPADPDLQNGYFLIRDHGIPFHADNWKETDFSDPKVWRRGRGFGLDIIHRAMQRVAYHPGTPQGNITVLTFAASHDHEESNELRRA
jgi:serine phosphatase RsbU (regulator of sigma subunit)/anti-sigma regulatory factor (Ser/Thr protein kinase)